MDTLSPAQRSVQMSRVRGKDTGPEITVRRIAHRCGYRFRLHSRKLPGAPDLVFPSFHKVIFVHGCFWHRHAHCAGNRLPKSRRRFWESKLNSNKQRDRRTRDRLRKLGWKSQVIWECETGDEALVARRIKSFLGRRES